MTIVRLSKRDDLRILIFGFKETWCCSVAADLFLNQEYDCEQEEVPGLQALSAGSS